MIHNSELSRRQFLASTAAGLAVTLLPIRLGAAVPPSGWPIGCFNRPWSKWSYDVTLDGIKDAGYLMTGLLTPLPGQGEIFTGASATPEYLTDLKRKIASRGLQVNMTALRVKSDLPFADAKADTRQQLVNAGTLGVEFALTFGESKSEHSANYYRVMSDAAAFAYERGIKLVMKPHGGGTGTASEILDAIKTVGHANFKIWYDAGNIIYYTGKDPVAELEPILPYVTGFCAKDCAATIDATGKPKREVMIQFGLGEVNFLRVFQKLKSGGFNGPIMVECCQPGATAAETTVNARANREFLETTLAKL